MRLSRTLKIERLQEALDGLCATVNVRAYKNQRRTSKVKAT
jgi:hypothetical protein